MVDLIIIILLFAGLVSGARRGLVVQLIQMVGFLISIIVAYLYYKPLAEKLVLWIPYPSVDQNTTLKFAVEQLDISQTFYQLLAFALIFFVVKFAIQIVASLFDFLRHIPILGGLNRILGGVLGFIEAYLLIFIVLYVLALIPIEGVQKYVDASFLTKLMLEYTPIISKTFQDLWFVYMK
ncbi:CvpA family protein [Rummeliibacillus pycnus]|uniref:CvpA family protein n=1 Tax=Rummeliibacillus pycnus TaxID=101070 RepID=UPI0037C5A7C8